MDKKLWTVIYETVNLRSHKTVRHFAAKRVSWKVALKIQRDHKRICQMMIVPAEAFEILKRMKKVDGEVRHVEKCLDCGHLFGRRFIPFGIGQGFILDPCLCQVTGHRPFKTVLESKP